MFHLVLTTCFAGILCYASEPDVDYISAERCLHQGAILSGLARAQLNFPRMEQTSRIACSGNRRHRRRPSMSAMPGPRRRPFPRTC